MIFDHGYRSNLYLGDCSHSCNVSFVAEFLDLSFLKWPLAGRLKKGGEFMSDELNKHIQSLV
jgi:hypothetical protein